ncbi:MAG: hypothetical protein HY820_44600 [Acidobacteria bacterium]|nr:hypothetical protein [Acidobacteriota bacterium]
MIFVAAYAIIGAVFAVAFLIGGVNRLDPAAKASGLAFRVIVFPGCVALWPLLAVKWLRGEVIK